jgi:hypothetical protein
MGNTHDAALADPLAADPELIEGAQARVPRVTPEAVAPASRIRSPIMERRRIELLYPGGARPSLLLPPLRSFVGPLGLAAIVATPILLLVGWQIALLAGLGAAGYRELDRRIAQLGLSVGDGFLPYRHQTGWPQGVQEDSDVRWNWSPGHEGQGARGGQTARG